MSIRCILLTTLMTLWALSVRGQLNDVKEVDVQQGRVRGRVDSLTEGRRQSIYSFRGIPYAKPPTEERRFRRPEEPESFGGTFDARESVSCPQSSMFGTGTPSNREECLTLDVYTTTPDATRAAVKPVLVYFPGGGKFQFAKSSDYGPKFLLDLDIVLVVVNYRTGFLGFLSNEDREISGNLGLFDQQMALKWVSMNIKSFAGDSSKVTLFGHDSGAASISMHLFNTDSRRFFHRAIVSGGSLFNPWAFHMKDAHRHTRYMASQLGCHDHGSWSMLDCLRKKPVSEIIQVQDRLPNNITFWPVIDTNFTHEAFFKESPLTSMEKGNFQPMPLLLGMTSDSAFGDYSKIQNEVAQIRDPDEALSRVFKPLLLPHTIFDHHLHAWERHQLEAVIKGVKYLYFRDIPVLQGYESSSAWVQAMSDFLYKSGVDKLARVWSKRTAETFVYHLEYESAYTFRKQVASGGMLQTPVGPIHMDDVFYFFDTPYYNTADKVDSRDVTKRIRTELFSALQKFMKEGNIIRPLNGQLVEWLPYAPNDTTLRINNLTNYNDPPYKNEPRYRAPQLDYFSILVPDVLNRTTNNVYYDKQEDVVSYGAWTWVLLVLVILALGGAVGYLLYKQRQRRKFDRGFEPVSTHVPAEKIEFGSKA